MVTFEWDRAGWVYCVSMDRVDWNITIVKPEYKCERAEERGVVPKADWNQFTLSKATCLNCGH